MKPKINRLFPGYIFDLDGTVWMTSMSVAPNLVSGAQEAVNALRHSNSRVVFLTNNSDGTREMFADQLTRLGIPASPDEILSTSYVIARYLSENSPGCRCFAIGPDPLREELCQAGLKLRDRPDDIDYVVLGIDRDFTYRKLQIAFAAIRAGAKFVATNPDPYVPMLGGDLPDIGALIAAIETATQHKLDMLAGKPNTYIVGLALETIGLDKHDCLLVGDQIETDVRAGKRAGVQVALLLRDPLVRAKLDGHPDQPDYQLESLLELFPYRKG